MHNDIGIFGAGYVGKAIATAFAPIVNVHQYDKYLKIGNAEETIANSEIIFICVPTPTDKFGIQDIHEVEEVCNLISRFANKKRTIVIKSTVLPGTTRKLAEEAKHQHEFIFNPEFLTARTANIDFLNQSQIIIGGGCNGRLTMGLLYRMRFPHTPILPTTWETAEFIKYACNTFFTMKLSFMNELYDIANLLQLDFSVIRDSMLRDGRIANNHMEVPGPDGKRGFGGACLPKDLKALTQFVMDRNYEPVLLKAIMYKNGHYRNDE